jgi:hypothetical protein
LVKLDPALTERKGRSFNTFNTDHECKSEEVSKHLHTCSLQDEDALQSFWGACSSEDIDMILHLAKAVMHDASLEQERRKRKDVVITSIGGRLSRFTRQCLSWKRESSHFPDRKCVTERIQLLVVNPLVAAKVTEIHDIHCLGASVVPETSTVTTRGLESLIYTEPFQITARPQTTNSDYEADIDQSG